VTEELLIKRRPDPQIGRNVRAAVVAAGRTQADVARTVEIEWHQWQKRTRGEVDWRLAELTAVARELGVPLSQLTGGES
jgi:hypothetical protein